MTKYRVPLVLWAIALAGLVLALIASVSDWPAQFGTDGSTPDGTLQWIVTGTALSAPLSLLVIMAVVGAFATRDGMLGMIADGLALILAAFTLVGSLGEAFAPNPVTTPRVVLIASGILGLVFAGLIIWAVIRDVRVRRALTRTVAV